MRASASSRPAGSGCSTSVTPVLAQAARFCSRLSGVHASLASTISSDSGAALRGLAVRGVGRASPPPLVATGVGVGDHGEGLVLGAPVVGKEPGVRPVLIAGGIFWGFVEIILKI